MALRQARIGSVVNGIQWDDNDYVEAIDTTAPIKVGPSIDNAHAVRRDQLPTLGHVISSDAVFADNAILRGDGGARKIQDSAFFISDTGNIFNSKIMLTSTGGLAVKLTNKTGSPSVKGEVVTSSPSDANAVEKIILDLPNPLGIFYESGIADGSEAWIIVSGIADVYFISDASLGHIARGFLTSDSGYVPGQAMSDPLPPLPFPDDTHFYKIGYVLESRIGAGLAKCVLQFN